MKLREIRIQNFKSLEDTIIEEIGDEDIFSGRNNSGKTAIFQAITTLRNCTVFPTVNYTDLQHNLFSGENYRKRTMSITLVFQVSDDERSNAIVECYKGAEPVRLKELTDTDFLKEIEYSFRSFPRSIKFGFHHIRITGQTVDYVRSQKGEGKRRLLRRTSALPSLAIDL